MDLWTSLGYGLLIMIAMFIIRRRESFPICLQMQWDNVGWMCQINDPWYTEILKYLSKVDHSIKIHNHSIGYVGGLMAVSFNLEITNKISNAAINLDNGSSNCKTVSIWYDKATKINDKTSKDRLWWFYRMVILRLVLLAVCWTGISGVSMISITDISSAAAGTSFRKSKVKGRRFTRGISHLLESDPVSASLIRTTELLVQVGGRCVPCEPGQASQ